MQSQAPLSGGEPAPHAPGQPGCDQAAPSPMIQQVPGPEEGERTTPQEAGSGPKPSAPRFLLRGWKRASPARAALQASRRSRPCVLSNLPNIAAESLSTVLFRAYFPSPNDATSAVPSLDGSLSHLASPWPGPAGTHLPRRCAGRSHPIPQGLGTCPGRRLCQDALE